MAGTLRQRDSTCGMTAFGGRTVIDDGVRIYALGFGIAIDSGKILHRDLIEESTERT
jgi:hypothetical protein